MNKNFPDEGWSVRDNEGLLSWRPLLNIDEGRWLFVFFARLPEIHSNIFHLFVIDLGDLSSVNTNIKLQKYLEYVDKKYSRNNKVW